MPNRPDTPEYDERHTHVALRYPPVQAEARHEGERCNDTVTPFTNTRCNARATCVARAVGVIGYNVARRYCPHHRALVERMLAKFYPNATWCVTEFPSRFD